MAITVTLTPDFYSGKAGDSIIFTANVQGLGADESVDSYQWKKGGVAIPNSPMTSTHTLSITDASSVGEFSVTAQIDTGTSLENYDSNAVTIIFGAPTLSVKSTPAKFHEFESFTISGKDSVVPSDFAWYRYEWWIDGVHDSSKDSVKAPPVDITISSGLESEKDKKYVLKIAYDTVEANNKPRTISSPEFKPTFESLVDIVSAGITSSADSGFTGDTISITAAFDDIPSGLDIQSLQWKKDGVAIPSATAGTYNLSITDGTSVGSFTCTAKIGKSPTEFVEVISPAKTISYINSPTVTITSDDTSGAVGDEINFTTDVTNLPAGWTVKTYQWQKDGVDISGKTTSDLVLTIADDSYGAYKIVVGIGTGSSATHHFTSNAITISKPANLVSKWTVHPIPWRDTSFTPLGYWVLDEILLQKALGKDWKKDYADYEYTDDVQTILKALNTYGECLIQDSRNGYIYKMSEI
ncbi:Hoc-like capsid decoration protein [Klebsiella phage Metamorpho]|nr:Hoc-like capsid decoration protein [Klebsiella phage Metamorpho]